MVKGTVCVAMSGGVDSAVVAAMLKDEGYDVIGVTLQIWQETQRDPRRAGCCSLGAVEDARRTARHLGVPHYVINYRETFKKAVIDEFVDEYARGRTPNPCVTCNSKVKFGPLLDKARELGCDKLATGHYARVQEHDGRYRLLRAKTDAKDQSYVLYMLDQNQLARVAFPLGELSSKSETRRMAKELGLPVADKPESQEICFVSEEGGYREFLKKRSPNLFRKGELAHVSGKTIGKHEGVANFTVGQRKGLGVSAEKPLYVVGLDAENNRVLVGDREELRSNEVRLSETFWSGIEPTETPVRCEAKIRYNMKPAPATLLADPEPKLVFDDPVLAATPGQIAVAYRDDVVLAGGRIL